MEAMAMNHWTKTMFEMRISTLASSTVKDLSFVTTRDESTFAWEGDEENGEDADRGCCKICLGLYQDEFRDSLFRSIDSALRPYSNKNPINNRFSRKLHPPVVSLPGDLVYRYRGYGYRKEYRSRTSD